MIDNSFRRHRIDLTEPGRIIAAVPHLFGYYPLDSLVVIALGIEEDDSTCLALRADLPAPHEDTDLDSTVAMPLASRHATSAVLIIVGGTAPGQRDPLPHHKLLAHCERRFAECGVNVSHQLWASATTPGASWHCYEHPGSAGTVPDIDSVLPTSQVIDGARGYLRREDIAATLAPVDEHTPATRADLVPLTHTRLATSTRAKLRLVEEAVDRAAEGVLPQSDHAITTLTLALSDRAVRDACTWWPDSLRADAAQRLWTTLVQRTPAPERAEPASMLAFASYQRGDGVLASIALDIAEAADPKHAMAELLRMALNIALPPHRLREAGHRAMSRAREQIAGAQP